MISFCSRLLFFRDHQWSHSFCSPVIYIIYREYPHIRTNTHTTPDRDYQFFVLIFGAGFLDIMGTTCGSGGHMIDSPV